MDFVWVQGVPLPQCSFTQTSKEWLYVKEKKKKKKPLHFSLHFLLQIIISLFIE
jgi:hypothetical protein